MIIQTLRGLKIMIATSQQKQRKQTTEKYNAFIEDFAFAYKAL
jgi:hypothetical protein